MNFLRLNQKVALTAFDVTFIDRREPKPRREHTERVVLNGGRLSALERLGQSPAGWITQRFEARGLAVQQVKRGETLTADVDLNTLWTKAATEKAVRRLGSGVAEFLSGEGAHA